MPLFDELWFDDRTLNDPKQIESDENSRLFHHFNSLGTNEERIDFILAGAFDASVNLHVPSAGGSFLQEKHNLFSPQEKEDFKLCISSFLRPYKFDGTLNYDEFEKRMDALATRIAGFHEEQCKFMKETDISSLFDDPFHIDGNREYVVKNICPESIQRYALKECLDREFRKVSLPLEEDYMQRKRKEGITGNGLSAVMDEMVKRSVKNYDPANESLFQNSSFAMLSDEEKKKVYLEANQVKAEIAAGYTDLRVWMQPEKNISIESLGKLDNLNGQLKDADHWYHRDSKEFKEFKAALNEAHEKFEQYKNLGRDLTDEEKASLTPLYDKVAAAADKYLNGKETRARKTGMGQDRYDIAFSALHITSRGAAGEKIMYHNMFNEKRGSKMISVKELEERAGRTSKQQKEYKKNAKAPSKENIGRSM